MEDIQPGMKQWPQCLLASFIAWTEHFPVKILGGHNIGHFDVLFLEEIARNQINMKWPFGYRTVDLHTLAFAKWGESLSHEKICERLGLPPEPKPHNALQGALSEYQAFQFLLNQLPAHKLG